MTVSVGVAAATETALESATEVLADTDTALESATEVGAEALNALESATDARLPEETPLESAVEMLDESGAAAVIVETAFDVAVETAAESKEPATISAAVKRFGSVGGVVELWTASKY